MSIVVEGIQVNPNASFRAGHDFYGPVTIASKEDRTPDSIYDIPSLLSPYFTGRDDELDLAKGVLERADLSDGSPARCIIYGMPGLGKTQFALKYAELAYHEKRHRYLFWISAASSEKLIQGFSRLLDLLNLAGYESRDQNARYTAAISWLGASEPDKVRRWLLILDNANSETAVKLRDMLPRSNSNGQILMTTRTQQTAKSLALAFGKRHLCIGLRKFTAAESVRLLLRISEADRSRLAEEELQEAEKVTSSVGCLPLVVDQAASIMQASGLAVSQVAELYTEEHREKALALEDELSLYEGGSIMITYTSALAQLRNSPPGTTDLLRILTFLDPENISVGILKDGILCGSIRTSNSAPQDSTSITLDESLENLQKLFKSPVDFHTTEQDLQNRSLVSRRKDGSNSTLWVHELVQDILRKELLENEEEFKRWFTNTSHILCNAFNVIENPRLPKYWDQCERFLTHIQVIQRHSKKYKSSNEELWTTSSWIASYLLERGRYEEAQKLDEDVLTERRAALGVDHPSTLTSMGNLASTYLSQGHWKEAEELKVQVIETRQRVLGDEHPDTLTSMANLASTYWSQGHWKEAKELKLQVMETRQRVLGDEHPDTLISMSNLASTYSSQGHWKEAEELKVQVMETRQRVLGDEHPDTLISMANLASTYWKQGRWKEAEELELQVMETMKRVLGDKHPNTLTSMANLAHTCWSQEERDRASASRQKSS